MGAKGLARGRSNAIRPWPDQEVYEGKDGAVNETLAMYFWQIRETDVIEISGVVVEPRWRYHNSRLSPKVRLMARTDCSEACLAVELHEK